MLFYTFCFVCLNLYPNLRKLGLFIGFAFAFELSEPESTFRDLLSSILLHVYCIF